MDTALLLPLVDAQSAARAAITERTTGAIERLAATVGNFADPDQILAYAVRAGQAVAVGQQGVASVTSIYLSRVATILSGSPVQPLPASPEMGSTWRHLPSGQGWADVYQRVAATYRVELAATGDRDLAFYKANLRARQMAETDLGLAYREQVDAFMRGTDRSRGARREYLFAYRRIIRPELSNGNVCGLCIAASTRVYYRGDLLPLHTGCHCEVMLVTRDTDPGEILNREGLDELYATAGGTDYQSLRRTKYIVHEHGELGPVLRLEGQHFTGPDPALAAA